MSTRAKWQLVSRMLLSLVWVVLIYHETGFATAAFIALVAVTFEVVWFAIEMLRSTLIDVLEALRDGRR